MKKSIALLVALMVVSAVVFVNQAEAFLTGKDGHEKYLYPVVRVSAEGGVGSGTVIYSQRVVASLSYSTYIITNYHVIDSAISFVEEWDPKLKKSVQIEKRAICHAEIFKFRNLSIPVGTMKIQADVVAYTKDEDMALLKLRCDDMVGYVASLYPRGKEDSVLVFDETVAVGCSVGFPPLPTVGCVTRKNVQLDSLEYWMSSSQIIYGNSGGAMFLAKTGELIGIPSRGVVIGWGTPITHMGLFIPINRIHAWLEREHYEFIFDPSKTEAQCLTEREAEIKAKQKEE